MQFYIVPALLMLLGATRIRGANANAKQRLLLDDHSSDSIDSSLSTGNIPGWTSTATSSKSNSNNYRRHLLPNGADATYFVECVLYVKVVAYEDGHEGKSWSCEFTYEQAATFGVVEMMDIEGLTLEAIEAKGAISGETIIRVKTAYAGQFFGSNDGSSNIKTVLRIPQDSDFEVEQMEEIDVRRAHNRRARRQRHRNLADSTPGTLKVLVVRVIDSAGAKVDADALQLQNDIFEDDVCLKTQYAACSHDQLILEPATEFGTNVNGVQVNGIVDVTIDATASEGNGILLTQAIDQATTEYGGGSSLSDTFDLVMFCLPPGSGSWNAYAYTNGWYTWYNDYWCQRVSTQMHEVGHNLNLAHSGILGECVYTDRSDVMGYGWNSDDTPKQCFNAAKSFQLGWYEKQIKSINPLNYYTSIPQTFVMNGVADYKQDGSNGDKLVALRLENKGHTGGVDYYIGYNRAIGANIGTVEAINTVTLLEKENPAITYSGRDGYGQSWRLAAMEAGGEYIIQNYGESGFDVLVMVNSINGKDASITISTIDPYPTSAPSASPSTSPTASTSTSPTNTCGESKLQIGLRTDKYPEEIVWTITNDETSTIVAGSGFVDYAYQTAMILPSETDSYCLEEEKCYTFTITDSGSDGICCDYGEGYYRGFLNGNDTPIFEGGQFESTESKKFCVSDVPSYLPSDAPGMAPIDDPSSSPSVSPSDVPSLEPSDVPSNVPSNVPSDVPSMVPSIVPSNVPSDVPSDVPSNVSLAPTTSHIPILTNPPSNAPTSPIATNQPTTTPGPCTNSNGTVQIKKKKTTTCAKLKNESAKKKKKFCKKNAVFQACPGVCNIKCTCTDVKTFKLNGEEKKYRCKKVGKKGQPECSGMVDNKNNILVEDVCPKKCDVCF